MLNYSFQAFLRLIVCVFIVVLTLSAANTNKGKLKTTYSGFDSIKTDVNDYQWPTDVGSRITSSFAEYRTMHFHGGIDVSTNGEVGHNIFAVRDGYVYRISIEAYSYGKMLYIRHKDGYYSVYAHLQKFSDKIEKAVRAEQLRKGCYPINLIFDTPEIYVNKGEVIALSGESGVGPPHLHFEIRDENLNNVNPFLFYRDSVHDALPPSIKGLALFPLDDKSTIDGKADAKYMGRFARGKGFYKVPQPIKVHGEIGFAINAGDQANGTGSKTGIHSVECFIDDSLIYSMTLDRFPVQHTKQIYFHYDYPTLLRGKGEYQKLFVDEGNCLPFYKDNTIGEGIIETNALKEGAHPYKIICYDFKGNTTTLEGTLVPNHTQDIKISNINENNVQLINANSIEISSVILSGKNNNSSVWSEQTIKKSKLEFSGDTIIVPAKISKYDIIKAQVVTTSGSQSIPCLYVKTKPSGPKEDIQLDIARHEERIIVKITSKGLFTSAPTVQLKYESAGMDIKSDQSALNEYSSVIKAGDVMTGVYMLEVSGEVNGLPVTVTKPVEIYSIPTSGTGSFSLANSGLVISYDSGAVYKPMFLYWSEETTASIPKYSLSSNEIILNKGLRVSVPVTKELLENNYALYFRNRAGWVFQSAKPDETGLYLSSTLNRTLGELTLMRDNQPPAIGKLRVSQSKGIISGNFHYGDNLSGVNPEEIKILLDNSIIIIPELDGGTHRAWFSSMDRVTAGKHNLTVIMKDYMGNEARVTRQVTVKAYNPSAQ